MVFLLMLVSPASAQSDSTKVIKKLPKDSLAKQTHSPKKAAILSACLPGLGQGYNHKYWKIPIIYVGLGGTGYFMYYTNNLYQGYKKEYIYRLDNPNSVNNFPELSADQLKLDASQYRRYRDLGAILTLAVYALNVVDANVDAHLFTFDVSNDLSFNLHPHLEYLAFAKHPSLGLSFGLKF